MTSKIESSWASSMVSIGMSAATGAIVAGPIGAAVGISASIIDECLMHHQVTQKHYLSTGMFWSACVINPATSFLLPQLSLPLQAVSSLVSSTALSYFSEDFLDFKTKIDLPLDAFMQVNRFFDEKEILSKKELKKIYNLSFQDPLAALKCIYNDCKALWNNPFFIATAKWNALALLDIATNQLFLQLLAGYAGNMFVFSLINNYKELFQNPATFLFTSHFKDYFLEAGKMLLIYFAKSGIEFWSQNKRFQLHAKQFAIVLDKAAQITLERGRDILSDEKGEEILSGLIQSLWELMANGVEKLTPVATEASQFLFALHHVTKLSSDALFPYSLSLLPMQMLLKKISDQSKEATTQLSKATMDVWDMKYEIKKNIELIGLKDAEEFMSYYHSSLVAKENQLKKVVEYQTATEKKSQEAKQLFHEMVDVAYFGSKILSKQIDVSQIPLIKNAINDLSSFLLSTIKVETQMQDIALAKERINLLFSILSKTSTYEHRAHHTLNDQNAVIFKNYTLFLDGKKLLQLDNCRFNVGGCYAITGSSGCGKTSALIDLKIGVQGALSSQGEISLPIIEDREPKVLFVDQNVYLPRNFSLLEGIYFPQIIHTLLPEEVALLKEKTISLFKEVEIDEFILDEEQDKGLIARLDSLDYKLSGGQLRKIAIIQAIFYQPDILILDETFVGLDAKSVALLQKIIKKYLPNVTILSVDHHARDNNYSGFYDKEVQFSQKGSSIMSIDSKSIG